MSTMMHYVCPADKEELEQKDSHLTCRMCGNSYTLHETMPVFATTDEEMKRVNQRIPVLEELVLMMETEEPDDAIQLFCKKYACATSSGSADWKLYLPDGKEKSILLFTTAPDNHCLELAHTWKHVFTSVSTVNQATIVRKQIMAENITNVDISISCSAVRLPFSDASLDAVAIEESAMVGVQFSEIELCKIAAEWHRILEPGGALVVCVSNPAYKNRGVRWIKSQVLAGELCLSLKQFVEQSDPAFKPPGIKVNRYLKIIGNQGFTTEMCNAPLPDESPIEAVVPVFDNCIIHYFLQNLVNTNTLKQKLGGIAVILANRLRLFHYLVPYYYLHFVKYEQEEENSKTKN